MTLFATMLMVCGKVNFSNLSRYSDLSERTYRRQYKQEFEFAAFNRALVGRSSQTGAALLAVMDCSFVAKSGKATFGLDRFWNGCASRVETGLEISVIGVVDVETEQGYALSAEQTYAQSTLPEFTRMDQYLYHLDGVRPHLPPEVEYLAVDGAYAKQSFVSGAVDLKLQVISKLRCDANLQFFYTGEQKRRGRPRQYAGKVDLADLSRFTFVETVQPDVALYTAVVFHVSLKRSIRVVYLVDRRHPTRTRTCLLFSTNIEQDPMQIYQYYKLRFQIEFIFRDAKQFTGLEDCQARDAQKLAFHFNASLTALNLAKFDALQQHSGQHPFVFSMASVKRRMLNQHLLDRFICNLDLEPSQIKSHPNYSTLCNYGIIAA
ncbi:transposase [Phormidesmis sp. 146-12]